MKRKMPRGLEKDNLLYLNKCFQQIDSIQLTKKKKKEKKFGIGFSVTCKNKVLIDTFAYFGNMNMETGGE